jgi:CubicO group peptidase (beta-lactamase class C family)
VPELAGTEYGRTSLRHLLQMSSGVRFSEDYPSNRDDALQLILDTYARLGPGGGVGAVTSFSNRRERPAGTKFAYASVETQVLGLVLARAIGRPVAEYLEQKIWRPMGAEADATWLVDNSGQEATYCCLNAVLCDYARLALLLAHDGNWRGRQIIPPCGFWMQPPGTWTCGERPRQPRATATRRGSFPANAGRSCSGARTGSGSTSIIRASSSW